MNCNLAKSEIFWGEIAPCDHVLQIYEDDDIFLDALTGFVGGGINAGDAVIVIATATHLRGSPQQAQVLCAEC
jgi:NAD(P)H-hydrate repair Nnr-like enzyme with NAD(P)H-hydrate epimerase domain